MLVSEDCAIGEGCVLSIQLLASAMVVGGSIVSSVRAVAPWTTPASSVIVVIIVVVIIAATVVVRGRVSAL